MSFGFNGLKAEGHITHQDSSACASGEVPGTQDQGSGLMKFGVAILSHFESADYAFIRPGIRFKNTAANQPSYLESISSTDSSAHLY